MLCDKRMSYLERETKKIKQGQFELRCRRIEWSLLVKDRILNTCKQFIKDGKENGYPYRLAVHPGSHDKNSETIQFDIGINFTGIEWVDKNYHQGRIIQSRKKIIEKNCALVFSQGPTGTITVVIYPFKSEVHEREEDNIILYDRLPPERLTDKLISKILRKSLFYARVSSLSGISKGLSFFDSYKLFMMKFKDIRSRIQRTRALANLTNEWFKLIVTIILTAIVTTWITLYFKGHMDNKAQTITEQSSSQSYFDQ